MHINFDLVLRALAQLKYEEHIRSKLIFEKLYRWSNWLCNSARVFGTLKFLSTALRLLVKSLNQPYSHMPFGVSKYLISTQNAGLDAKLLSL